MKFAIRRPLLLSPADSEASNDCQADGLQPWSAIVERCVWRDAHVLDETQMLFVAVESSESICRKVRR